MTITEVELPEGTHASLRCKDHGEHGYWPFQHHAFAVELAMRYRPPQLKLQRMLNSRCLICGGPLELVTVTLSAPSPDEE